MIRTASGPSPATSRDACAKRKSPVRIAIELSQRAFADFAPRRRSASSITSSWYSVARWINSTTAEATITSSDSRTRPDPGGDQGEQRPEPLAAGVHQVRRGLGDEVEVADEFALEQVLDPGKAVAHPRREIGVGEFDAGRAWSGRSHRRLYVRIRSVRADRSDDASHVGSPTARETSRQQRDRDGQQVQHRTGIQPQPEGDHHRHGDDDDGQDPGHHHVRARPAPRADRPSGVSLAHLRRRGSEKYITTTIRR